MSDTPAHNSHDKFFKETLGRTTTAAEFFREYLPQKVASKLEWDQLERKDGSFDEGMNQADGKRTLGRESWRLSFFA